MAMIAAFNACFLTYSNNIRSEKEKQMRKRKKLDWFDVSFVSLERSSNQCRVPSQPPPWSFSMFPKKDIVGPT
jgi:hypothetical protein